MSEPYAAWIGLDWGSKQHAVALQEGDSQEIRCSILPQTPEAMHDWILKLRLRFPGRKVAVAIEQSKGAVIHFLLGLDFVHVYRIHPKSLKNYREALYPSGAKDDPSDARLLLLFVRNHTDRLQAWVPDDPQSRALSRLVEFRRKTVGNRTRVTNALTELLKEYFPQALDWAGDLASVMACDFLAKWPTLQKLQKAKPETIRRFYQKHGSRSNVRIVERLKQIRVALPLTEDEAVIRSSVLMVQTYVAQLRPVLKALRSLDKEIKLLFGQHPDAQIFDSFPGAGQVMAPRLQAAMGANRDRFDSAEEVQNYSGISPVLERSGKKVRVRRRMACSRFVRQTFHEFAGYSIGQSPWARAFYDMKRHQGKGHHAAVRALAYKWIRIIFRCWMNHIPYDESLYLQAIQKRNAPCLAFLREAA